MNKQMTFKQFFDILEENRMHDELRKKYKDNSSMLHAIDVHQKLHTRNILKTNERDVGALAKDINSFINLMGDYESQGYYDTRTKSELDDTALVISTDDYWVYIIKNSHELHNLVKSKVHWCTAGSTRDLRIKNYDRYVNDGDSYYVAVYKNWKELDDKFNNLSKPEQTMHLKFDRDPIYSFISIIAKPNGYLVHDRGDHQLQSDNLTIHRFNNHKVPMAAIAKRHPNTPLKFIM